MACRLCLLPCLRRCCRRVGPQADSAPNHGLLGLPLAERFVRTQRMLRLQGMRRSVMRLLSSVDLLCSCLKVLTPRPAIAAGAGSGLGTRMPDAIVTHVGTRARVIGF